MTGTLQDPVVAEAHEEHVNHDFEYIRLAVVLALITAVEVCTYLFPDLFGGEGSIFFVLAILGMMSVKFFMVAWVFMHLKFDNKLLTYAFYSGLILALGVYLGVLTTFRVWWGG